MSDPVSELAQTLQTYGPWAVAAVQFLALGYLFRKYESRVGAAEQAYDAWVKRAMLLAEEMTKASVEHTNALEKVGDALTSVDRRLEDVEKKFPGAKPR